MKAGDLLAFAATALARHRLRTGLSVLGMAVGVAAVVTLSALGEGARRYVAGQFRFLGSNLLSVLPGKVETSGGIPGFGGAPHDLTLDDALALQRGVAELQALAPVCMGTETVAAGARSRQALVFGTSAAMQEIQELELAAGAFLPEVELERGAAVAVLGSKLAAELFPGAPALGRSVRVGAWRMRVIGVLRERGMHLGFDLNEIAFIPVATAMRVFDRGSLFRVVLKLRSAAALERVEDQVLALMRARHGEEDVTVVMPGAVVDSMFSILRVLTLAVAGIAAVSLSVAGIGIMNVMLVTVAERSAEIGLLQAIGARRRQILALFLSEAAYLAAAGAALGLLGSWLAVQGLKWWVPEFPARPPAWAVAAALFVALGVGLSFGVLPARRAAALDPVAALARKI